MRTLTHINNYSRVTVITLPSIEEAPRKRWTVNRQPYGGWHVIDHKGNLRASIERMEDAVAWARRNIRR